MKQNKGHVFETIIFYFENGRGRQADNRTAHPEMDTREEDVIGWMEREGSEG